MANALGLAWALANPFGIQMDAAGEVWMSGHLTDVLEVDSGAAGVLVAPEKGGVWSIPPAGAAVPLSNGWDIPDVNCLAAGPDGPRHFFAGTDSVPLGDGLVRDGLLYETELSAAVPLLAWQPVDRPVPAGCGAIHRVLVLTAARRLVVLCSGGAWWASIPTPASPSGARPPFAWTRAVEEDFGQDGYFDGALGSVRPGAERPDLEDPTYSTVVAGGRKNGIALGRWSGQDLVLKRAVAVDGSGLDMTALYFGLLSVTSVASCAARSAQLYAASANPDGYLRFVFRSGDAGQTWTPCGDDLHGSDAGLRATLGQQGNGWNNCIAVPPDAPGVVAVGWQKGTFISPDAGASWFGFVSPHVHDDVHVLRFRAFGDDDYPLLIGSDGGLAEVSSADVIGLVEPPRASSAANRALPIQECYATFVTRQFYGALGAGRGQDPVVVTGVQDNGDIACRFTPGAGPWQPLADGDGGWTGVLADGGIVGAITDDEDATAGGLRAFRQSGSAFVALGMVPVAPIASDGTDSSGGRGLIGFAADVVRRPSFRNDAGGTLYAVAAAMDLPATNQVAGIYGLFGDAGTAMTYHWERIADIPGSGAQGVASATGATIYVGTGDGRIFALDTRQRTAIETPVSLPPGPVGAKRTGGAITRLVADLDAVAYAVVNAVTDTTAPAGFPPLPTVTTDSFVVRLDGLTWSPTAWAPVGPLGPADGYLYGLEILPRPGGAHIVVVTTDAHVYASRDHGDTWEVADDGLPTRPHNAELRYQPGPGAELTDGVLYLSTFGRSLWQAPAAQLTS